MDDSWDDYAAGWDNNESVMLYSVKAYESLLGIVNISGCRVLDFGCGTGLLTEKIAQLASSVVAIDPSSKMISVLAAKELSNVSTVAHELTDHLMATDARFEEGFDLIVASSALAFVPNYQETLNLLKTLLKQGGVFIQWDWLKDDDAAGSGFSEDAINSGLKLAGFSQHSTSTPFSIAAGDELMKVVMGIGTNS